MHTHTYTYTYTYTRTDACSCPRGGPALPPVEAGPSPRSTRYTSKRGLYVASADPYNANNII